MFKGLKKLNFVVISRSKQAKKEYFGCVFLSFPAGTHTLKHVLEELGFFQEVVLFNLTSV